MLAFLQALHPIAAKRGDGLRPEFLRRQIEDVLNLNLPDSQPVLVGLVEENVAKTMTAIQQIQNTRCALDHESVNRGGTTKSTTVAIECRHCRNSG
ncbi:Uncharacterized protein MLTONO_0475 [Mesorhizobium loti]|nr:Uncharacterized protein MLTONO_0475 [Mesorhizobium loti]